MIHKIVDRILFFDGVCGLCNKSVDYLLRHNRKKNIFLCSLQSEYAQKFLQAHQIDSTKLNSLVYYENGKVYTESTAIKRILPQVSGIVPILLRIALVFPPFITNPIYRIIAKVRYKIFGKMETCRIPNSSEKLRFLC